MKMGAMRGPKSFEVAAEFSDGCHHALSYTREAYEYMIEHCTIGAERAGKDVQDLDLGAWVVFSVGEDSAKAKDAARSMVGLYASSMPHEQLQAQRCRARRARADHRGDRRRRHGQGHRADHPRPRRTAVDRRHTRGVRREAASQITSPGINHMILAITDAALVKALMGREIEGVPDVNAQLQLIHDRVMPAFA